MKVALICEQLGVPTTLATTAFVTALADGFARNEVETLIVGLVRASTVSQPEWDARALEPFAWTTPWLDARAASAQDAADALRRGVRHLGSEGAGYRDADWYDELVLERELEVFADGGELLLLVYPISTDVLRVASSVARRHEWRVVVQSCESLSGSWIDQRTRASFPPAVAELADGVWALSRYLAEFWQHHGVAGPSILVQPNVVRSSAFVHTPAPGTSTAVFLGNLSHSDAEMVLEVAALVRERVPSLRVRIYGDASLERRREFQDAITSANLTDAVSLEQPVEPALVPAILRAADIALLPRAAGEFSQAGFPNKLGEYLASGRPVVATAVGDIPHYLADGESAMLVPTDDAEAFADAVARLFTDPTEAARIGEAGAAVAKSLLDSASVARRLLEFAAGLARRESQGHIADTAVDSWLTRMRMVAGQRWRRTLRGARRTVGQRLRARSTGEGD